MNSSTESFVLIPGAGGMAWYWHRVAPLLESAGRTAIAVDLPGDDEHVDIDGYADIVVRAIADAPNVVLVAQSLAGFTAPLVCERTPIQRLVFVNAMIPRPGETPGSWWENTGSVEARVGAAQAGGYSTELDPQTYFLHDVPEEVLRDAPPQRRQSEAIFRQPCRFNRWPSLPIRVIASANDRFFPLAFQRRVARDRLEIETDVVSGGHLVALSNPKELADRLL